MNMAIYPVLAVSFFMSLVAIAFIICAVVLILVILIQKGKGGGLSSAFGGAMASGILGSKTGDFLTWVTIAMVGVFLMLAVVMAKFYKPGISDFDAEQSQPTQQLPAQRPATQQIPVQQPPARQELPQSSEPPTAPAKTSGESTDINSLSK
jgi:preprotein translocase subunit SecG